MTCWSIKRWMRLRNRNQVNNLMLVHSCVTVRSLENARQVFEDLFQFKLLYTFEIASEIFKTLFKIEEPAHARVYDTGNSRLEVFVMNNMPEPGAFQHICLGFPDRDSVIEKAEHLGFEVRKYHREDATVVFVLDADKNLYELKNKAECY